jgi:hypothetical protein
MNAPPFHKFHEKNLDDRVKIPRHAADESRGYYQGIVINGTFDFEAAKFMPGGNQLIVEWDAPVPFLGKYSGTMVAIKVLPIAKTKSKVHASIRSKKSIAKHT